MLSTWSDSEWRKRLMERLEPLLKSPKLISEISTYQGVPFALFVYRPTAELELRREVALLSTRIETETARRVHVISMADLVDEAIKTAFPPDGKALFDAERSFASDPNEEPERRLERLQGQMEQLLSDVVPVPTMIQRRVKDLEPERDILFLVRIGALFPVYRASSLLENLMGEIRVPTILFYPGERSGTNSLRFMDSLEAIHSYRCKIY